MVLQAYRKKGGFQGSTWWMNHAPRGAGGWSGRGSGAMRHSLVFDSISGNTEARI